MGIEELYGRCGFDRRTIREDDQYDERRHGGHGGPDDQTKVHPADKRLTRRSVKLGTTRTPYSRSHGLGTPQRTENELADVLRNRHLRQQRCEMALVPQVQCCPEHRYTERASDLDCCITCSRTNACLFGRERAEYRLDARCQGESGARAEEQKSWHGVHIRAGHRRRATSDRARWR